MRTLLRERFLEALRAVGPLIATAFVLHVTIVDAPAPLFLRFLGGAALATVGMALLFAGIDLGILPMGRFIGADLPRRGSVLLIVAVAFALGFATTAAEPDVLVLGVNVEDASNGAVRSRTLVYLISTGVGVYVALGLVRVVRGFSLVALLFVSYLLVLVLCFIAPAELIPLAFDAGSVTTGVLTAPVVLAVALGLSSVLSERSALSDGFGLLGLASIGPILVLLIVGLLLQ